MFYPISLTIGIILLGISLYMLKQSMSFLKTSERAKAVVIELKETRDSDGSTYKPVFKFKTLLNKEIIYTPGYSSSPPSHQLGEEATIAYDPANPEKAKLLTYFGTFLWTIIFMCISLPFIVIGGGYYLSQYFLK